MLIESVILITVLLLDHYLGEPRRWHPLIAFGKLASTCEKKFNLSANPPDQQKRKGILSWMLLVVTPSLFFFLFNQLSVISWVIDGLVVYWALGLHSLKQHALQVYQPLKFNDLDSARHYCGYMVSRDTAQLSEEDISRAVTESVLENGHDAVIATLFWYVIGGAPLVIVHRLANTLDAMWGYKNSRYQYFGWFSAKMDDWLGWPSAKLTAVLYAMQNETRQALCNACQQSREYKSINGGWVMAAGATSLGIQLGGTSVYEDKELHSPSLGEGKPSTAMDISRSVTLVQRAALLFVLLTTVMAITSNGL